LASFAADGRSHEGRPGTRPQKRVLKHLLTTLSVLQALVVG
jgi:hypothetical protein